MRRKFDKGDFVLVKKTKNAGRIIELYQFDMWMGKTRMGYRIEDDPMYYYSYELDKVPEELKELEEML
jgi:hypothetical protein